MKNRSNVKCTATKQTQKHIFGANSVDIYSTFTLRLNNLKIITTMNPKISVVVVCVEAIIHLLLYNLHDCTFKRTVFFFLTITGDFKHRQYFNFNFTTIILRSQTLLEKLPCQKQTSRQRERKVQNGSIKKNKV